MDINVLEAHITEVHSNEPNLGTATVERLVLPLRRALKQALAGTVEVDPDLLRIPGMSGRKYRMFINSLVHSLDSPRYLEVGCWAGSTLCAAINGNDVTALAIDNWSEFGSPREAFWSHLNRFRTPEAHVRFLEADFRNVDFRRCGSFNIYLFDGPHLIKDQYDGVKLALPALDPEFVLIIDDWNWAQVRSGTFDALDRLGLEIAYMVEIRTSLNDTHATVAFHESDWHNGYFIAVIRNPLTGRIC